MKYQVIARKFRPQVFDEVVGQRPIVQTLRNAIEMGRVGHAYLFCGPRGVGKTTTARILAKGLNCAAGPTISPCNTCASCQEIALGRSMDVLEIDAASNTGVDNVRELRENARYAPARDRHKIFIIDEVHMLSTSAFNALLKILEEPPSHVIFVMATTERHKLPATILSRCQQFVFRTIPPEQIHAHLQSIASREGVKIDDRALNYIVRASEGSMRDAQSLLDQIIAFGGQSVSDDDVREVLGFVPDELLDETIDALADRSSSKLLEVIATVVDQGLNVQQYVRELSGRLRQVLLIRIGLETRAVIPDAERDRLSGVAGRFSEQDLIRCFDVLLKLDNDLRWTAQPRFHTEAAFVRMAYMGHVRDIEEVLRELKQDTATPDPAPPARVAADTGRAPVRPKAADNAERPAVRLPIPEPARAPEPGAAAVAAGGSNATDPAQRFRQAVEEHSITTAVHLQRASSVRVSGREVAVEFRNTTHIEMINSPDHKSAMTRAAESVLGEGATVKIVPAEGARDAASSTDPQTLLSNARGEPLVQQFLEVFRGDLSHVKPKAKE